MTEPKKNQYAFGVDPDKGADPEIFIEGNSWALAKVRH